MDIILLRTKNTGWNELSGYLGCLDPARRKGVLKKAGDSDKTNALLSRLLLLSELEQRTQIPMKKLSFEKGSHGKPYLKNSEVFFSMSHTSHKIGGAIVVAFSNAGEIGVDVESKSRVINERMFGRALTEQERENAKTSEAFLSLWVRKEAFLKRLGIGITRDLRTVSADSLPDTVTIDCGEFFVGASGKGTPELREIQLTELLGRFVKLV